jgi:hypothetical protein
MPCSPKAIPSEAQGKDKGKKQKVLPKVREIAQSPIKSLLPCAQRRDSGEKKSNEEGCEMITYYIKYVWNGYEYDWSAVADNVWKALDCFLLFVRENKREKDLKIESVMPRKQHISNEGEVII